MVCLEPHLRSLLASLPPSPVSKERLDSIVRKTLEDSKAVCPGESRKTQWEYLLKDNILSLAVSLILLNLPC